MAFHFKQNLWIFFTLLLVIQMARGQDGQPSKEQLKEDSDYSSSEAETVEESNESEQRRRRRSTELSDNPEPPFTSKEVPAKNSRAIPGLPDPAAILKIAEILTNVGQEVLPILVEGNTISSSAIDRFDQDMNFVKMLSREITLGKN